MPSERLLVTATALGLLTRRPRAYAVFFDITIGGQPAGCVLRAARRAGGRSAPRRAPGHARCCAHAARAAARAAQPRGDGAARRRGAQGAPRARSRVALQQRRRGCVSESCPLYSRGDRALRRRRLRTSALSAPARGAAHPPQRAPRDTRTHAPASSHVRLAPSGEKGIGKMGKPLHFKGSAFHRVIPQFMCVRTPRGARCRSHLAEPAAASRHAAGLA